MTPPLDPPQPGLDPLIGQRLGDFQVLDVIGQGGMGIVYGGIQPIIKKRVAIKVLRPEFASDVSLVKRLVAEAQSVNSIHNRNIIDIFGLGQLPDGRTYIVMEFLDGTPLDAHLRAVAPLPQREALELLAEICTPLIAAHAAGIIHRDLKPSNVFLVRQMDGTRFLKLLDFGIAKRVVTEPGTLSTTQHQITGTPSYMAPEQCRGLGVGPRTDLYALGVLGFELLTGRLPFVAATGIDMMMAQVGTRPEPPSRYARGLSPEVDRLILRLLEKAPESRPASADEVRGELRRIAEVVDQGRPAPAVLPLSSNRVAATPNHADPGPILQTVAPVKQSRWPLLLGVGLLGTAALGWLVWSRPPPAAAPPLSEPPTPTVTQLRPLPVAPVETPPPPPELRAIEAVAPPSPALRPPPPRHPIPAAPTTAELGQAVERLEARLHAATQPGATPDPSALKFLDQQRLAISVASTPAERLEVVRKLERWERQFLPK